MHPSTSIYRLSRLAACAAATAVTFSALGAVTPAGAAGSATPAPASTPSAAGTPGAASTANQRLAVVLVNFRNSVLPDVAEIHKTAHSYFFDGPTSVAHYMAQNSDNRRIVTPAAEDGVLGPFTLDMDADCDTSAIGKLAKQAISNIAYEDIAIVFPDAVTKCGWGGLGVLPGHIAWFPAEHLNESGVTHELGHNLGLFHERRSVCVTGSFTNCKPDGWSNRTPMGGGGYGSGLSSPELLAKKWLTTDQVARIEPVSSGTFHLLPLHSPWSRPGLRAINLPIGSDDEERIVIEHRAPAPGSVDQSVPQGVNVYHVSGSRYADAILINSIPTSITSEKDASLQAGATLEDTTFHISITVVAATADGADVRVELGAQPSGVAVPSPSPEAAMASSAAGTAAAEAADSIGDLVGTTAAKPTGKGTTDTTAADKNAGSKGATATGTAKANVGANVGASASAGAGDSLALTGGGRERSVLIGTGSALTAAGLATVLLLRRRRARTAGRRH